MTPYQQKKDLIIIQVLVREKRIKSNLKNIYYNASNFIAKRYIKDVWVSDFGFYKNDFLKFILNSNFKYWPIYVNEDFDLDHS